MTFNISFQVLKKRKTYVRLTPPLRIGILFELEKRGRPCPEWSKSAEKRCANTNTKSFSKKPVISVENDKVK